MPHRSWRTPSHSHPALPWTICRSLQMYMLTCIHRSVHCIVDKTADGISMPFGVIGQTGPRITQVLGFRNRPSGTHTMGGALVACHCNQCLLYGVGVPQCLNRLSCSLGWCVCRVEALCITWRCTSCKGKGTFGVFWFSILTTRKCKCVNNSEMLPIRMQKLGERTVGKLSPYVTWLYIQFQHQTCGYEKVAKM